MGDKSASGHRLFEWLSLSITSGSRIGVTATSRGALEVLSVIEELLYGRSESASGNALNRTN